MVRSTREAVRVVLLFSQVTDMAIIWWVVCSRFWSNGAGEHFPRFWPLGGLSRRHPDQLRRTLCVLTVLVSVAVADRPTMRPSWS